MSVPLARRTEAFIVRIWIEYLAQTPPVWRGEIEHVDSKEVIRFGNLEEMKECIFRCTMARDRNTTMGSPPRVGSE